MLCVNHTIKYAKDKKGPAVKVQQTAPIEGSLLCSHTRIHDYLDCFFVDLPRPVSFENFVEAFYTTWLFKLERLVLWLAGYRSSDIQARQLAKGETKAFAVWVQQSRSQTQLLMTDINGATCSWLMVAPQGDATRLYFGSGVRARPGKPGVDGGLPRGYRALMGLHVMYSRALLSVAASQLLRAR